MLFRKYNLIIFHPDGSGRRQMRFHAIWMLPALALLIALAAGNAYYLRYFLSEDGVERKIRDNEALASQQQMKILSLVNQARSLEGELTGVCDLDGKLQLILELSSDDAIQPDSMGGSYGGELSPGFPQAQRMESLVRSMHGFIKHLATTARMEEVRQQEIIGAIRSKQERWDVTPSIHPVFGRVTSPFGWRVAPFTGRREFHQGLDLSAPMGTPVVAPARGRVTYAGREGSYGRIILMAHGYGITTRYAHLSRIGVSKGEVVERGQVVGWVGNSGRSTGPHLHYEVRKNNRAVNPAQFIAD